MQGSLLQALTPAAESGRLGTMQKSDAKSCCMQVPEQNGHGGGEDSHSIALSVPYTQRAQRELRVSKQQVRPVHHQKALHAVANFDTM